MNWRRVTRAHWAGARRAEWRADVGRRSSVRLDPLVTFGGGGMHNGVGRPPGRLRRRLLVCALCPYMARRAPCRHQAAQAAIACGLAAGHGMRAETPSRLELGPLAVERQQGPSAACDCLLPPLE